MSWSLNEIDSLARKATRGAGYSWGLAEEAGRATRWLCAMGLPGADCLAGVLAQTDGVAYDALCPDGSEVPWKASGGTLCPLITGAAICDNAATIADGREITLQKTACPLLLYPFVAVASDMTGTALSLSWGPCRLTRCEGISHLNAEAPASHDSCDSATIRCASDTPGTVVRRAWRGEISAEAQRTLSALAHRTYAPDTPESRMAGAGAGLTDND